MKFNMVFRFLFLSVYGLKKNVFNKGSLHVLNLS